MDKVAAEAKVEEVLEWPEAVLAYLYVMLYEGRGLRYESCLYRLRKEGWR